MTGKNTIPMAAIAVLFCTTAFGIPALGTTTIEIGQTQGQLPEGHSQTHHGAVVRSFTQPIDKSVVASTENGVVKTAIVREGDYVKAGAPLAELNHDVLVQTRRQAQARAKSTAAVDAAKLTFEMVATQKKALESLIANGHANQFELQQKTAEFNNAAAQYRQAQDDQMLHRIEVDRIDAQIQQRIIKSPIDGVVIKLHKQPGEQVSTNEPQYATVVRIDQLKVRFYLPAKFLNPISAGAKVAIQIGPQRVKKMATVLFVSPVIDPDSGTGRIEVVIDNYDNAIKSGTVCYWANRTGATQQNALGDRLNSSLSDALPQRRPPVWGQADFSPEVQQ